MIQLNRITDLNAKVLDHLFPLYEEAFPESERRSKEQLKWLIANEKKMIFNVILSEGETAGLHIYWDLQDFCYLEHLVVFPEMRNRKVGQQVLDYMKKYLGGLWLLEVEPIEDEMTGRRVGYYERNGYKVLDRDYIQPPYDRIKEGGSLWIMGNGDSDRLAEYIERIKSVVYRGNYDWNKK